MREKEYRLIIFCYLNFQGEVISLNQQIRNFENVTLPELEEQTKCKSKESLKNYLFVVGSGGNDYSLNYFLGLATKNITIQDFTANLTMTLSHQLKVCIYTVLSVLFFML